MALSKQLQRIHEAIMTIKQYGGVFGRNPTFNDVTIEGQLTFDGDIDINTDLKVSGDIETTGNVIIATSGNGIDFSATSGTGTSELLDDYEEGTWTPTLEGAVSAGSYSVAIEDSSCKYTKVGRQVTVTGKFTFTVSSAGSGYAKIGGLPFATSATNAMTGTVRTKNIGLAAGTVSLCILNSTSGSAIYFSIAQSIDNAASVFLDIAGISSTDQITMTLTYFI
jgi:hypothetical protein